MTATNETREIWFEHASTRLFAIEHGSQRGLPVIFLHGGLSDHRGAAARLAALAGSQRLITPDVRAAGRSRFAGELSWALLADDVIALIDHLGAERAVVGGISAGSAIALAVALRHPRRLQALVLVSPVYAGQDAGLNQAQRAAMASMDEAGQRSLTIGIEALVPLFSALPEAIRERALAMVRSFDPASVAATTRFLASGVQPFRALSELTTVRTRALIVPGTDPEHPAEVAVGYAAALPHATLTEPSADLARAIDEFIVALR